MSTPRIQHNILQRNLTRERLVNWLGLLILLCLGIAWPLGFAAA